MLLIGGGNIPGIQLHARFFFFAHFRIGLILETIKKNIVGI